MNYKKITKKELVKKYEELNKEYKEFIENGLKEQNIKNKFENMYYELKEKYDKLKEKKIEDLIKKSDVGIVNYLKKRINETQGDNQKRYKDLLKKYIN